MAETMGERAEAVAAELQGTCHALDDHAAEEEINSLEFCEALDALVFCCESCGWWCGQDENADREDGWYCRECAEECE